MAAPSKFRAAFTLLEVMAATMIVALLAFTLYRFLSSNLRAIRLSTELSEERESLQAVVRILQTELNDLPPRGQAALTGRANRFHNLANDEITWTTHAGPGLLTDAAAGEFRVTLTVQPVDEKSVETELGMRRQRATALNNVVVAGKTGTAQASDAGSDGPILSEPDFSNRGVGGAKYNWVSLIRPMAALEIRYFDPRFNAWVEVWNNPSIRPPLVRVRLWKFADAAPVEAILQVPSASVTQ